MGMLYDKIDCKPTDWLSSQRMFFVATSPSGNDGLIHCPLKGGDYFGAIDAESVAYLDLTGSGIETVCLTGNAE
ncbi:MAG: hypothetical protein KDN22_13745 [Verrucomicrobiae bacterium]|nr:hypothetical protein [Verrucomicrobiae bacterium]